MATHISLIRHGESEWNALRRYQGHAPVPLNEAGQDEIEFNNLMHIAQEDTMPWTAFQHLTDDNIEALYLYITSVPPIE